MSAEYIMKFLCKKNNITFIRFSREYKIIEYDENVMSLTDEPQHIKVGEDIRNSFYEIVGLEDKIDEFFENCNKGNNFICVPMLNKKGFYYDLEIELCELNGKYSLMMYFTKKSNFLLNYTKMVQKVNKKTLFVENEEQSQDQYHSIINQKLVTFNVDTDGIITDLNRTCSYFFGLEKKEMLGKHFSNYIKAREIELNDGKVFRATKYDGEDVYFHTDIIPLSKDGVIYENLILCQDITYLKRIEEELIYAAGHDSLTGLANRSILLEKIEEAIVEGKNKKNSFAICFIDLDKFKGVNDNYGHHAGDMLLKHLSKLLLGLIRDEDTASRVGGDEFVVLIKNIQNKEYAQMSIQRINDAIENTPLRYSEDETIYFSCSLGVSVFPDDGEDAYTLLKLADKEMYVRKRLRQLNPNYPIEN
jgi:diguanylate cyclase (GGDEF)-like protein/PAS domain S-box-containing protein